MRLADFIERDIEPILTEWVAFAEKQLGSEGMNLAALRDHASEMLAAIVRDLRTSQTDEERQAKSHGEAECPAESQPTAAEAHGAGRATSGFSVAEMLAEFRALRASVLRLWTTERGVLTGDDIEDLSRFHEAIDQALAESISRFHTSVTQSQDLLVAVLGHDLRAPLNTVAVVTQCVADAKVLDAQYAPLMDRAVRSARRMGQMLDDLLDFTRSRMGNGLTVHPVTTDLGRLVDDAVDEFRTGALQHEITVNSTGDLHGTWDGPRISQVLSNLLGNAIQHGDPTVPVRVFAKGMSSEVVLEVQNAGPTIPATDLATLFNPFKRLRNTDAVDQGQHLGLGLYIADQIVSAHGGRIVVRSTEETGTCFAAHLPR